MTLERVWGGSNNPEIHDAISKWVSFNSFGFAENAWPDGSSYGILRAGKPIAGVVYHDYKPSAETVQYSGAAVDRTWLQGPSLHLMFSYMFDDLGCQMVLTGNAATNTGLHRLLRKLDHKLHVIERGWARHTDLYLWSLTREQWIANPLMNRSRVWAKESENV